MTVEVRRAVRDDLDALAPLFDAYRGFYGQAPDLDGARAFLGERLARAESVIFIAATATATGAAGFTQLYPLFTSVGMRRLWLLNDLFVAEHARRGGVASALMQAAHAHARETQAVGVLLETQLANRNAQALYEKLGYRRNEETQYYWLPLR